VTTTAYVTNRREVGNCDVYTKLTATETVPRVGTAAVDPKVFRFGTQFKIPGYGYAVARDTGGAVRGHIIDLVFPTCKQAFAWGRRSLKISFRIDRNKIL